MKRTKNFLTMAALVMGMAMMSVMMTSCAKEDNAVADDTPKVDIALEEDIPMGTGGGYISDVMVIGAKDIDECNEVWAKYRKMGWILINIDLNKDCGPKSDYVYLLYKYHNGKAPYNYITDIYLSASKTAEDTKKIDGRTYHLAAYDGGQKFKNSKGDLNSQAGGDYIHLYYTKENMPDRRAITNLSIDKIPEGAVGKEGSTAEGYNLSAGVKKATKFYLHTELFKWKTFASTDRTLCYIEGFEGNPNALSFVNIPAQVEGMKVLGYIALTQFHNLMTLNFDMDVDIKEFENAKDLSFLSSINVIKADGTIVKANTLPTSMELLKSGALAGTAIETLTLPSINRVMGSKVGAFENCTNLRSLTFQSPCAFDRQLFVGAGGSNIIDVNCTGPLSDVALLASRYSSNVVFHGKENGKEWSCGWCGGDIENKANDLYWRLDTLGHLYITNYYDDPNLSKQNVTTTLWSKYGNTNVKKLTLRHVNSIPAGAFQYMSNLESVELSDNLIAIPDSAFFNCPKLKEIELPDGVSSIGAYAFAYDTDLGRVKLSNSLNSIGAFAFLNCKNLKFEFPTNYSDLDNIQKGQNWNNGTPYEETK